MTERGGREGGVTGKERQTTKKREREKRGKEGEATGGRVPASMAMQRLRLEESALCSRLPERD